jgi:hypothetical protein
MVQSESSRAALSYVEPRTIGEMSEWFKEHAWKACVGVTPPWVRIPLSPLIDRLKSEACGCIEESVPTMLFALPGGQSRTNVSGY